MIFHCLIRITDWIQMECQPTCWMCFFSLPLLCLGTMWNVNARRAIFCHLNFCVPLFNGSIAVVHFHYDIPLLKWIHHGWEHVKRGAIMTPYCVFDELCLRVPPHQKSGIWFSDAENCQIKNDRELGCRWTVVFVIFPARNTAEQLNQAQNQFVTTCKIDGFDFDFGRMNASASNKIHSKWIYMRSKLVVIVHIRSFECRHTQIIVECVPCTINAIIKSE